MNSPENISPVERAMLAHHGRWAVIGRVLALISTFLVTVVLSRVLSPVGFTEFTVLRNIIALFALVAAAGVSQTAIQSLGRITGRPRQHATHTLRQAFRASIVTHCFSGLAVFGLVLIADQAVLHREASISVALIVAIASVALGFSDVVSESVRGMGDAAAANMIGGTKGSPVANGLFLTFALVLYRFQPLDAITAMLIFSVAVVSVALAGMPGLFKLRHSLEAQGHSLNSMTSMQESETPQPYPVLQCVYLTTGAVLAFCCTQGDIFLLGWFPDDGDEVAYVAAKRLILIVSIPLAMLNNMAFGVIPRLLASNRRTVLESTLRNGATLTAVPCLLMATMVLIFPALALRIVLGDGYSHAAGILRILVPGQVILVLSGSCGVMLALAGHFRMLVIINSVTLLLIGFAGSIAASHYGAVGLAVTMSCIVGLQNLTAWSAVLWLTGINTWCRIPRRSVFFRGANSP